MNPVKTWFASMSAFAILSVICSVIIFFSPGSMTMISGNMIHADLPTLSLCLTWPGFFIGLTGWVVITGVMSWLIASIYKLLFLYD